MPGHHTAKTADVWKHERTLLIAIVLVGFALRIATVLWGTPILPYHRSYHPDEPKLYKVTADFPRVYWTDQRTLVYGTAVSYTLGVLLLPVKAVFMAVPDLSQHYVTFVWLISRLLAVCLGTGTVWLGYAVARRLFDVP